MIIQGLLNVVKFLINIIFGWIHLPAVPDQIVSIVDRVLLYVKSGLGLLWLFVPFELVKVMIPLVIAVVNFDKPGQISENWMPGSSRWNFFRSIRLPPVKN